MRPKTKNPEKCGLQFGVRMVSQAFLVPKVIPSWPQDLTIAKKVAKKVAHELNKHKDFKAILTRDKDIFINLNERSEIARKAGADLLISIHADGYTSPKPSGASVLVISEDRASYEFNQSLHSNKDNYLGGIDLINEANFSNDSYLKRTFLELGMQSSLILGYEVANKIQTELSKVTKMHQDEPREQNLAVLKSIDIPSVLVEVGFMTNKQEAKKLQTNSFQKKLAKAISKGIYNYFNENTPKNIQLSSHSVEKGDTLSLIAQRYNISVADLKKYNNLTSNIIYIGQVLKIKYD